MARTGVNASEDRRAQPAPRRNGNMRVHIICHGKNGMTDNDDGTISSGLWDVREEHAAALAVSGGYVLFHESKAAPSYLGGRVVDYDVVYIDAAHPKRVVLKFKPDKHGVGSSWEGRSDRNAWFSGIIV
jgi:hypothetical protein